MPENLHRKSFTVNRLLEKMENPLPKSFSEPGEKRTANNQTGVTIIELLVVLVLIAILAVAAAYSFSGLTSSARDAKRKADLNFYYKALTAYYLDHGFFPTFATAGVTPLNCVVSSGVVPAECQQLLSELRFYAQTIPFDPSDTSTPGQYRCTDDTCYQYLTPDPAHSVACICAQLESSAATQKPPACSSTPQNYCIQVTF